ncbi:Transposase DDE domain-containing protein [Halogranum amylolyticum]|uniref:Transposase DDE domain-containing protein n=1 Tax=Halogranum amylolyticum TaxID=660520 RepID=A0A1H8WME9_9EURY|nr:ISH3 family transposase [Halogranum amylolyticum]SEP28806.1 Transposase DDE domain-containing protein [Halogranum amylolyticum]
MRFLYHPDTVLTAFDLENLALELLSEIPIPGVEGCGFDSGVIRQTLLQAAVEQTSIKAVSDDTRGTYSDDYTLTQLHTVPAEELERLANHLLRQQATMILGPTPRIICLDFVDIQYHGCSHLTDGELCHTTPRDGTSKCHRYLAGFVLCRAKPLIVAVTAVRGDESKNDAVERLLDHVVALPFDVVGFLCDRGFYNRGCIQQLRATAPVALPVIGRGERIAEKLETSISYWTEYAMYEGSERELRFPLAVCVPYQQGNRGKHGLLVRAYVACDLADRTPKEVEALYQKRSAIETAFRTMREARARTTTTNPVIRLLFVVVSFLLRNLWLIVRWGVLATPRRGGRALPTWFRFEVFRTWIDHVLGERLVRKWAAQTNGVGIPATYGQLDAG